MTRHAAVAHTNTCNHKVFVDLLHVSQSCVAAVNNWVWLIGERCAGRTHEHR